MCEGFRDPVSLDDAALNLAITGYARTEAAAAGHRLAAIAALATRRLSSQLATTRERWACDGWDSCCAEIAADLTISHRKASGMLHQALDLHHKLPRLEALLRQGRITAKVATTASWRTQLIEDPDILAKVDAELAETATGWGSYSDEKLSDAIDAKIEKHDPDAVRRFHTAQKKLDMKFGKRDDATGTRSVYGLMDAVNAEIGERRTDALAKSVCPDDPRTLGERRIAAYGVIMAGGDVLPCLCGNDDCPAPRGDDARGKLFDILVLTDDPDAGAGVDESDTPPAPDPDPGGPDEPSPRDDPDYDMSQHWYDDPPPDEGDAPPPPEDEPEPGPAEPNDESVGPATTPAPCSYTSIFAGGAVIPAALLADIRRMGASVRTITRPEDLTAEPHYRPSTALQRFVRARDMTCCFTGCNRPAEHCDFDHAIPYPNGPTHPGNGRMLCRKHHLLKTFWVGEGGWSDEQLADGTIVWTSPSGLRHRAPPGSRIYFPTWDTTTPLPDTPAAAEAPAPGRELKMPTRRRTRAQQRAADIKTERTRNHDDAENAENTAPF